MTENANTNRETVDRACEIRPAAGLRYIYAGTCRASRAMAEHICPSCEEYWSSATAISLANESHEGWQVSIVRDEHSGIGPDSFSENKKWHDSVPSLICAALPSFVTFILLNEIAVALDHNSSQDGHMCSPIARLGPASSPHRYIADRPLADLASANQLFRGCVRVLSHA